jgi:hypothetical protein
VRIVIFGPTISSSWGNGHATLWRGLCKYLVRLGHSVVFFERDVPYYAGARDLFEIPGGRLVLYSSWDDVQPIARSSVMEADAAIVTSYCPDALTATDAAPWSRQIGLGLRVAVHRAAPLWPRFPAWRRVHWRAGRTSGKTDGNAPVCFWTATIPALANAILCRTPRLHAPRTSAATRSSASTKSLKMPAFSR